MPYATRVSYVAGLDQRDFDVTFPYLQADHVEVSVSGTPLPWAAYDWIGTNRIRLKVDPGAGNVVSLRRRTPLDQALVTFRNGSVLSEAELNTAVRQTLYVQQELLDLYADGLDKAKVRLGENLGIVTDPEAVMDELVQMVLADELMADLNSRLRDVNITAEALIEEQLRTNDLKNVVKVVRDKVTIVETETEQMASVLDLIAVVAPDGASVVLREDKVYRGNGETFAQAFTGISTRLGDAEAGIVSNQTAIATESTARASDVSALSARIGSAESSITTLQQVDAGLSAKYGVALNVNGYVTGFVQNNNGSSGSFVILANRFAVVDPNQGSPIVPFEVESGWLRAPRVRAGDVYANTITTNHLIVGGVTTEKLATNAVTNGASAHTEGSVGAALGLTQMQAVGLSTVAGSRVQMSFSAHVNPITFGQGGDPATQRNILWFRIYRNGTYLGRFLAGIAVLTGGSMLLPGGLAAFAFSDSPPSAGWQVYEVYAEVVNTAGFPGSITLASRSLNVLETKR